MITGIVVALPEELSTLISGKVEKGNYAPLTSNIFVAFAGAGPDNARQAAELLINSGAGQLVSWGCAAALSPALAPGSLVIADALLATDQPEITCNKNWIEHTRNVLAGQLTAHIGSLSTSATLVSERQDKQDLYHKTAALAVDMESYAVAITAEQAGLPCLVLRSVADPADMNLPKAISYSLNSAGEVELTRLLRYVLTHPQEIPGLVRLGRHFASAKTTLKLVSKELDKIMGFNDTATEQ